MTALTLQTFLLLGVAYLAGCMLACVLRRSMHAVRSRDAVGVAIERTVGAEVAARAPAPSVSVAPAPSAPVVQPTPASVSPVVRQPPAPLTIARNPVPAVAPPSMREGFRRADTLEPSPQSLAPTAAPSRPVAAPLRGPEAIPVPSAPVARIAPPAPPSPPRDATREEDAASRFRRALDGPGQATSRPTGSAPAATAGPPATPKPSTALPAPVVIAPKAPDARPAEPRTVLPAPEMTPQPRPPQNVQTPPVVAAGAPPVSVRAPMIVKPPMAPTPPPSVKETPAATVVSAPPAPSRPVEPAAKAPAPVTPVAPPPIAQEAPAKATGVAAPAAPPIVPTPVEKADTKFQTDDLTRIRGIDGQVEAALSLFGVTRYAQIAAWRPEDVARLSAAMAFRGRIEQENWIEQAQILARGEETAFSRQLSQRPKSASPPAEDRRGAPNADAAATPSRAAVVENRPAQSAPPNAQVVASPAAGPAVTPPVVRPMRPTNDTAAASAAAVAAAAATRSASPIPTPSPQALGLSRPAVAVAAAVTPARSVSTPDVSDRAAFARSAAPTPQPSQPSAPTMPPQTPSNPAPANPNVQARTADLSNLRSVRSEAFRSPNAPSTTAELRGTGAVGVGPGRFAVVDDLKRIRGIGVLIEKKLNSMGITGYEEIANWSSVDIDRVSQVLDFKGRIERENWVEQARILAVGGQTEFSRRSDRGE